MRCSRRLRSSMVPPSARRIPISPAFRRARRVVPPPAADDVRAIRRRLGLTQAEFAAPYGFSVETIRNYEQGHRRPAGPARVLLKVIALEPDAVTRALQR